MLYILLALKFDLVGVVQTHAFVVGLQKKYGSNLSQALAALKAQTLVFGALPTYFFVMPI